MTCTIKYTYDPSVHALTIYVDGKMKGGFRGKSADKKFAELIMTGEPVSLTDMESKALHRAKVRRLRAIWIQLGIDEYRGDILQKYGVESTADLTDAQLDEMIKAYQTDEHKPVSEEVRKLRSELLSLAQRLGIYNNNGDWRKVNEFFLDNRIAGKMLFQMTEKEMRELRPKLHSIVDKHIKNKLNEMFQQKLN